MSVEKIESWMWKRVWDPVEMRFVRRNLQTGEGLFKNTKAFGKAAFRSLWKSEKRKMVESAKSAATSAASSAASSAGKSLKKYAVSKIREKQAPLDGKRKIFNILSKNTRRQKEKNKKAKS